MAIVVGGIGASRQSPVAALDPDQARAYARATNDLRPVYESGALAPPIFGVVPTWDATMNVLGDVVPDDFMAKVLHLEQDMHFHQPLIPGMLIGGEATIYSIRTSAAGARITILTTSHDGSGAPVIEQYGTLFIRGLTGLGSDGPDKPPHSFPAEARDRPVRTVTLDVDADQPYRYRDASGDTNRIHVDDEFARAVGLPGVILHGLCTMAMCGSAVVDTVAGGDPARLRRLAVRFSKPVLPGDQLEVSMYEAGHGSYAFEATSGAERVIREGRAEVTDR